MKKKKYIAVDRFGKVLGVTPTNTPSKHIVYVEADDATIALVEDAKKERPVAKMKWENGEVVFVTRSLTKRELVDKLIELGVAVQFNALLGELPLEEKLRWESSPTISPDYPFIRDNRELICNDLGITEAQLDRIFR